MQGIEIEWRGEATIPEVGAALDTNGRADVVLPANYNHALFVHLYPDTEAGMEDIDVTGGTEVVRSIAEVEGLQDLDALADLVEARAAEVRVISPPRIIITHEYARSV
jgi:hypothetical protein